MAKIHPGYYLIGRDRECQIRPKSRSVSRKHCLLHHVDGQLRVFDLESTSGTRVEGDKIPTKQWVTVEDGVELRLGKIAFGVSVRTLADAQPVAVGAGVAESESYAGANSPETNAAAGVESPGVMVTGSAWQEVDIADFLESEDDAAREERYATIRTQTSEDSGVLDEDSVTESDSAIFDNETTRTETAEQETSGDKKTAERPRPVAKPLKRAKPKKSRIKPAGTTWDLDRIKMLAACVVTVLVFGFLIYSVFQFVSGEPPNIVEGID